MNRVDNSFSLPQYEVNKEKLNLKEALIAEGKPAPMRLEALKVPRASELVADRLRTLIVDGVVREGSNLPPEKDLVVQLGVSRATLREALRILEAEGLILTKTGPRGGIMVQRPGSATLTRSLSLLLKLQETPFSILLEARRVLEPMCAKLGAERATDKELRELEQILNQMRQHVQNIHEYVRSQLEFHMGVIACAHNDVLRLYTLSVGELISAHTTQMGLNLEDREVGIKAAEGILNAMRNRDGGLAARRVESHLKAFESIIEKGYN